jgi:hypothetical protein
MDTRLRELERCAGQSLCAYAEFHCARARTGLPLPEEMRSVGYDWSAVFDGSSRTSQNRIDTVGPTSAAPVSLGDVVYVAGMDAGERDGPQWVALVLMADGRWIHITAGCDYTGWG